MHNRAKVFKDFESKIPIIQGDSTRRELINWFAEVGLWGGFWSLSGPDDEPRLKKIRELSEPLLRPGQSGIMVISSYVPINLRELIIEEDGVSWGDTLNRYAAGYATPDGESSGGIATIADKREQTFQARVCIFLRRFAEVVDSSPDLLSQVESVSRSSVQKPSANPSESISPSRSTEELLAEIDGLTS